MRTIKDPKKTPEVRRRIDIEEEETSSSKSTPPKKRRAAKSKQNDSLNDSGSTTIEDGLSDKSFGQSDSVSDTSSLKSTPPKKRGYNNSKLVKSHEQNGEIDDNDDDDHEAVEKKVRPKRAAKKLKANLAEEDEDEIAAKPEKSPRMEVNICPAESTKFLKRAAQKAANDRIMGKKKESEQKEQSPVKETKKLSPKAQSKAKKNEVDKTAKTKTALGKKRKLKNENETHEKDEQVGKKKKQVKKVAAAQSEDEDHETIATSTPSKPKKVRKTKKQLEKEMAEELKRQTEEQRNNHEKPKYESQESAETVKHEDSEESEAKYMEEQNELLVLAEKLEYSETAAKTESQNHSDNNIKENLIKHESKGLNKNEETVGMEEKITLSEHEHTDKHLNQENDLSSNNTGDANQVNVEKATHEADHELEESELDTSFESISSGYRPPDEMDELGVENKENENKSATTEHAETVESEHKDQSAEHTDTKVEIKCEFCGSISKSKGGHTRHLRKCQPQRFGEEVVDKTQKIQKLFMCENCDYSAPRRVLVITHMKSHGIHQCKRCKFRADSAEGLDEHLVMEHKDRSDCKFCKLCNRYVKCNEIPLEKHMEECQGRVPFKCPECSKEFQYESSLKCHVVSHYPDKPKLFSCDQCDYKSNYKANLKKHIRHIHEQKKERDIKCLDCDKLFYTDENMRRHLKLHSEERPYKCEEKDCDKAFKTPNGLKFHILSHNEEPLTCSLCLKEFKSERCLVQHNKEVHDGAPKSFKCHFEGCEFAFYKKSGLDRHIAYHTDNRSFFCTHDGCSKAFRTPDALKIHELQHANEHPISCEHCDYICKQRNSLRYHMLKKHPEIVQKTLEMKQKLVSSKTQTLFDTGSDKSVLQQDNHIDHVSEVLTEVASGRETESIRPVDPLIMSPKSVESSIISSPIHHPEEKSITMTAGPITTPTRESEAPRVPIDVPLLQTDHEPGVGEKSDLSQTKQGSEVTPVPKSSEADLYEFQSEDEDGHQMQPGLLRKEYDKDKPPLPPVSTPISSNITPVNIDLKSPEIKTTDKPIIPAETVKVRKKPGPKPKPKPEKTEEDLKPKKRGRKKKSETEKAEVKTENNEASETKDVKDDKNVNEEKKGDEVKKTKGKKRTGSPKGKKDKADTGKDSETESESPSKVENKPEKKKRGRKPKPKVGVETKEEPVKKKRGRKPKVKDVGVVEEKVEAPDLDTGEQDATINYSEVEGGELLTDSKDGVSDINNDSIDTGKNQGTSLINISESLKADLETSGKEEKTDQVNAEDNTGLNESAESKKESAKESEAESDRFSSDLGSDFEEDLKPPPAPRPPPMYDSEDGDIESGPENEDFNNSMLSNEPLRDFESSREISREISRDFESSRDESAKNPGSEINSVETATPTTPRDEGQPMSNKMDSVRSVEEHSTPRTPYTQDVGTPHHSHPGSVPPLTPSHSSIPPTPTATNEFESRGIDGRVDDRIIDTRVDDRIKGQNNDENTDESSMPEVDKDYVGRFFEEIQSTVSQPVDQITRMNSMEESSKTKEIPDLAQPDSGVPSSLTSTESNMQMQSPPADLSMKRMEMLAGERPQEEQYQPRPTSESRPADRIPSVYDSQFPNPLDPYGPPLARDSVLRQAESVKVPSPNPASFMRFPESDSVLQRQKMGGPYDRNIQNLQRITDSALPAPAHTSSSPLLRHDMFPSAAAGSVSRNPFQSSWTGQDVRPAHWSHPAYLQRPLDQHSTPGSSSLFGKDSYLASRDFMFDPTRVAAERNMFSSLASSQRPDIPHDTFQFDRFDLGSYLSSHGYNASPSLPVDYTRATHSSTQKTLDERYRQSSSGVSDFRGIPPTSSSDVFGVNSSFNLEKYGYPRDPLYHSQHLSENPNNPLFPHGVPSQHSMFGRDYPHRSFYTQNTPYGFMNEKNYAAASAKLGHSSTGVPQQRELVPVPRPNMSAPESQLQDPYRHHSSMLYNMMNRYGFE